MGTGASHRVFALTLSLTVLSRIAECSWLNEEFVRKAHGRGRKGAVWERTALPMEHDSREMGRRPPIHPHTALFMARSSTAFTLLLPYVWALLWLSRQRNRHGTPGSAGTTAA